MKEEYSLKFASLQATLLSKTNNFKLITSSWTSLHAYIPLLSPAYAIAQSVNSSFLNKHPYPIDVMVSHTRLWESAKAGRIFLTLSGDLFFNNSKLSYALNKIDFNEYKNLGGTDTLHSTELKNNKAYIGNYNNFITTSIKGRMVYFPSNSHIGISYLIEKNFGKYAQVNSKLSVPIVLINSKKNPAVNFEFYLLFVDMNNVIETGKNPGNKTIAGLSVGIPLSRLMY